MMPVMLTQTRPLGDGMDSEMMSMQPSMQTAPPLGRHRNLTASESSAIVERNTGVKFVAREPVKGAVMAVGGVLGGHPTPTLRQHPANSRTMTTTAVSSAVQRGSEDVVIAVRDDDTRQVEGGMMGGRLEGEVEGGVRRREVDSLKQQLLLQTKVNNDLKNMLVASVGDDLHHKLESLVRTKAVMQCELCDYNKRVSQHYESLDQLAIQADLWRSKFVATRLLSEKLGADKKEEHACRREAERALQQLLAERQQLNQQLVDAHRYLKLVRDSLDPGCALRPPPPIATSLDLAETNTRLSQDIKLHLVGSMPLLVAALDAGIQNRLSPAEQYASQVLLGVKSSTEELKPADGVMRYNRFHPQARYDDITLNCCQHCTGEIQVV